MEQAVLLQKDSNPALNTVTAYGDDYLEINQERFRSTVCFTPQGPIRNLDLRFVTEIDAALLKALAGVDALKPDPMAFLDDVPPGLPPDAPEVMIIGTGHQQAFLAPDVIEPLLTLGIGVETMTTQAAARTYNILMSEDRHVLALLLPGVPH